MYETRNITPNPEQASAIAAPIEATLNVIAGAGTGKTTVLVDRYVKLVRDDGVEPDRILALTFTLKAAAEMRHRVHEAVRARVPHAAPALHGAWIMNFHQFGFRLIKENAPALGVDPDVDVLSPAEFHRIRSRLQRRFSQGELPGLPEDFGGEMPSPRKLETYFGLFFDVASRVRGYMDDVEILRSRVRDNDPPGYRAWVDAIIAVASGWTDELRQRNLIDFTDMITIPVRALARSEALQRHYVDRFDHILVDEFQDTSVAQNELVRILSGGDFARVTVVGDDKQSIYRWRDARVENIREFPGDPLALRRNFRSYQGILDLAHDFICRDETFAAHADEIRLIAERGESDQPIVLFHPIEGDGDGREVEAEALAVWVRCLTGTANAPGMPSPEVPLGFEDITILMRSLKESFGRLQIERAFVRHGIPYALIGAANAAETRALELLHAWLSLLLPGRDERELLAVLERAPFVMGDAAIYDLFATRVSRGEIFDRISPENISRVADDTSRSLLAHLATVRGRAKEGWMALDFHAFVDRIVEESPVMLTLADEGVPSRAIDDVLWEVHEIVDTLAAHDDLNLPSFLEHLRVAVDEKSFRDEGDIRFPAGRVRIMTMHQSKGLEFPAVAVTGIKRPHRNDERFFLSRDEGVFFAAKEKAHWERGLVDTEEKQSEDRMAAQEARCLLYVAMTRARDFLWVSAAEPDGGKTLFADVLASAGERDGVTIVRVPPVIAAATPSAEETGAGGGASRPNDGGLRGALERRAHSRSALASTPEAAPRLTQVAWRGLEAYARCPLEYRYASLDALSGSAPTTDSGADDGSTEAPDERVGSVRIPEGLAPVAYGVLVHEAVRAAVAEPERGADEIAADVARRFGHSGVAAQKVTAAVGRLLTALRASELGEPGEDVALETAFQLRLERAVFHGVFDRIERAGEQWRVIDYKVGTPEPDHGSQVAFYAWALERITGKSAAGFVCYLREDAVTVQGAADRDAIDRVAALAERLDASLAAASFPAAPGTVCRTCRFRPACPQAAYRDGADTPQA